MDTRSILEDAAAKTGWNTESMLDVLTEYVDNQQSHGVFQDFVNEKVEAELDL